MGKQMPSGLLAIFLLILGLTGCTTTSSTKPAEPWTAERYYQAAREAQISRNFQNAIDYLAALSNRYPDSPYADLVPLESAYAHYHMKDYQQAIRATKQFIALHPDHSSNDYAHYLTGLSYTKLATEAAPEEIQYIRLAFEEFSQIIQNHPQSKYHADALKHADELRNRLAQHELDTIKQHLTNGDTTTAMKRARYLSENYANTPAAAQIFELISSAHTTTISAKQDDSLRSENWLLKQNPQYFTIQIVGSSSKTQLEAFVMDNDIKDEVAYYRREDKGKAWYSLLYGSYKEHSSASKAAQQLKSSLPISAPWIRRFGDIQKTIQENQHH